VLQTRTKGPVPEGAPRHPCGGPLVPARNRAGTKGLTFSPASLVPVGKPGLKPLTGGTRGPVPTSGKYEMHFLGNIFFLDLQSHVAIQAYGAGQCSS
jgi:hypothetical protein